MQTTPQTLKDNKAALVKMVTAAIAKAPETVEVKITGSIFYDADLQDMADTRRVDLSATPHVTFQIGRSTYKIVNSKECLSEFRGLVSKNYPTAISKKAKVRGVKYPGTKPKALKVKGLDTEHGVFVGKYKDKPFHSNGAVLLFTAPSIAPKTEWDREPLSEQSVGNLMGSAKHDLGAPVGGMDFIYYDGEDTTGISTEPITEDTGSYTKPTAYVRLKSARGSVYINQNYYTYILAHFPDATLHVQGAKKQINVTVKGKVVGLLMPMRVPASVEKMVYGERRG